MLSAFVMAEKVCLQWNEFSDHISCTFTNLRDDNDFADVTLACEDGEQVEAHRVVLSAACPFLKNLLKKSKHQNPLVYMLGVNSEDLKAMVDFIYFGKVKICEDKLDSFLALATQFEMPWLSNQQKDTGGEEEIVSRPENWEESKIEKSVLALNASHEETDTEEEEFLSPLEPDSPQSLEDSDVDSPQSLKVSDVESPQSLKVSDVERSAVPKDCSELLKELDLKVSSMMSRSGNMISTGKQKTMGRVCNLCGKEGQWTTIYTHIEAKHLEGVSLPCDICGKTLRSRSAMRYHKSKHHGGLEEVFFLCNKCEKTFKSKAAMRYHKLKSKKTCKPSKRGPKHQKRF